MSDWRSCPRPRVTENERLAKVPPRNRPPLETKGRQLLRARGLTRCPPGIVSFVALSAKHCSVHASIPCAVDGDPTSQSNIILGIRTSIFHTLQYTPPDAILLLAANINFY
eukprot:2859330-Pyramimonas_sp.AAC.1